MQQEISGCCRWLLLPSPLQLLDGYWHTKRYLHCNPGSNKAVVACCLSVV